MDVCIIASANTTLHPIEWKKLKPVKWLDCLWLGDANIREIVYLIIHEPLNKGEKSMLLSLQKKMKKQDVRSLSLLTDIVRTE